MGNFLAITNLHDGVDLCSFPNMHLMKTYAHNDMNDAIFKVSLMDRHWLVSGGQDGSAHLYDVRPGQLFQKLEHSSGGQTIH
jgi:hypothetical protein